MGLFIVTGTDRPGHLATRMANRPAHLAWAAELKPRIRVAGPMLAEDGETLIGSHFIIEGASAAEVRALFADDPYVKADLFETFEVRPFRALIGRWPEGEAS